MIQIQFFYIKNSGKEFYEKNKEYFSDSTLKDHLYPFEDEEPQQSLHWTGQKSALLV